MKRKLALLLVAVMTATMLPMNLFAASTNSLERNINAVKNKTQLYMTDAVVNGQTGYVEDNDSTGSDKVLGWAPGAYFNVEFKQATVSGDAITLKLENAKWSFGSKGDGTLQGLTSVTLDSAVTNLVGNSGTTKVAGASGNFGTAAEYADTKFETTFNIASGGVFATDNSQYSYVYAQANADLGPAEYVLAVSAGDASEATLVVNGVKPVGSSIRIPLSLLVNSGDSEVALNFKEGNSVISTGRYPLISTVTGGTVTTIKDVNSGRGNIGLGDIIIKETKLNSLNVEGSAPKAFTITLSPGFEFVKASTGSLIAENFTSSGGFSVHTFPSNDQIMISLGSLKHTSLLGALRIQGLQIKNVDKDVYGEVTATIEDIADFETKLTAQTLVVAERVDYGVSLTQASSSDKIPTLVAGRLPSTNPANAGDKFKLVEFRVEEKTAGSLWINRDATLVFPEGVLVVDYEVNEESNCQFTPAVGNIDANEIDINLTVDDVKDPIAFDVKAWVSIPADFGGNDITVSITNAGVPADAAPLVVAKTVAPISVETKVSTVKVGAFAQAVANIVITENAPGALLAGKNMNLRITDAYGSTTNNLMFANGVVATVTEGDIKLNSITTGAVSSGSLLSGTRNDLIIPVKTASRTASTITLSNVNVVTTKDLPETSGVPYKVYVYGPAVAENYGTVYAGDADAAAGKLSPAYQVDTVGFDYLEASGYFTNYVEVSGVQAPGTAAIPTKEFILVANATSALVDGNAVEFTADMATYLDPAGTVMLSTRLVAEAFGLVPLWDDATKAVTIVDLAGNPVVMFPVGKTYYVKNGMNVPMVNNGVVTTTVNKDGRTFVSLRQMANALGLGDKVDWDDSTKTVTINKKAQ